MQGWRVHQEDAHNSILNFDNGISLFAVYDGHGGSEVAKYCSFNLPDYIKRKEEYIAKNYKDALVKSFLAFDAKLKEPKIRKELKVIANQDRGSTDTSRDDADDEIDDIDCKKSLFSTVRRLRKDSELPLGEVMRKLYEEKSGRIKNPGGPVHVVGKSSFDAPDEEPSTSGFGSGRPKRNRKPQKCFDSQGEGSSKSDKVTENVPEENGSAGCGSSTPPLVNGATNNSCADSVMDESMEASYCNSSGSDASIVSKASYVKKPITMDSSDSPSPSKKGKAVVGPAILSPSKAASALKQPKIDDEAVYDIFKMKELSDESDSDDETFEIEAAKIQNDTDTENTDSGSVDDTVSEDNDHEHMVSDDINCETESDIIVDVATNAMEYDDEEEEEEEDDDDDDDDDSDDESDDEIKDVLLEDYYNISSGGSPGFTSGCTALLGLITEDRIYVANVGDSRCVASKAGVAYDLSVDHKPEDELERLRIEHAGGCVEDGRVNDGLNLSRAIGDHHYKRNKSLPAMEQMISANPDVTTCDLTPDLEFIVMACDGIWNSMSSQQAIDFVKSRLSEDIELSNICEQLFDKCLAPTTAGDGTGCDNMTCIIIMFPSAVQQESDGKKHIHRSMEDGENTPASKRQKTAADGEDVDEEEEVDGDGHSQLTDTSDGADVTIGDERVD